MRRNANFVFLICLAAASGGQILAEEPAPAASAPQSSTSQAASPPKRLDLRVPHITQLYTPEEIERLLANTRDIEEVEVEGAREPPPPRTPEVWGGIAAPVWAVLNPTQAWRIFAPIPPDRARALGGPPDATSTYREPIRPLYLQ